jgi:hypothetical protein
MKRVRIASAQRILNLLTVLCAVLYQVGLERDLALLDAGDMTEVGEKGLTLRYVFLSTMVEVQLISSAVGDKK